MMCYYGNRTTFSFSATFFGIMGHAQLEGNHHKIKAILSISLKWIAFPSYLIYPVNIFLVSITNSFIIITLILFINHFPYHLLSLEKEMSQFFFFFSFHVLSWDWKLLVKWIVGSNLTWNIDTLFSIREILNLNSIILCKNSILIQSYKHTYIL